VNVLKRLSIAVAATTLLLTTGVVSTASAGTGNWQIAYVWGGETRMGARFNAGGNESVEVIDMVADGYGAYFTWWSDGRSGNCNDTNGSSPAVWIVCGPLNLPEDLAFDARQCSKDYNGSTLVDSRCTLRRRMGTT